MEQRPDTAGQAALCRWFGCQRCFRSTVLTSLGFARSFRFFFLDIETSVEPWVHVCHFRSCCGQPHTSQIQCSSRSLVKLYRLLPFGSLHNIWSRAERATSPPVCSSSSGAATSHKLKKYRAFVYLVLASYRSLSATYLSFVIRRRSLNTHGQILCCHASCFRVRTSEAVARSTSFLKLLFSKARPWFATIIRSACLAFACKAACSFSLLSLARTVLSASSIS